MAEHKTSVTGPTIHCNETHVPDSGGAAAIKSEGHKAAYPSKSQGTFRPLKTAGELTASKAGPGGPEDHKYFLAKSYEKKGPCGTKEPKPFEGA